MAQHLGGDLCARRAAVSRGDRLAVVAAAGSRRRIAVGRRGPADRSLCFNGSLVGTFDGEISKTGNRLVARPVPFDDKHALATSRNRDGAWNIDGIHAHTQHGGDCATAFGESGLMVASGTERKLGISGDERRAELIRIVFNQIAEKGFEGFRFQEVAAAAGITNATLYYYFASKEAMIQGLVEWLLTDLSGKSETAERHFPNAMEELCALFADLYTRVTNDIRFFVVITELALRAQRDPTIAKIGRGREIALEKAACGNSATRNRRWVVPQEHRCPGYVSGTDGSNQRHRTPGRDGEAKGE